MAHFHSSGTTWRSGGHIVSGVFVCLSVFLYVRQHKSTLKLLYLECIFLSFDVIILPKTSDLWPGIALLEGAVVQKHTLFNLTFFLSVEREPMGTPQLYAALRGQFWVLSDTLPVHKWRWQVGGHPAPAHRPHQEARGVWPRGVHTRGRKNRCCTYRPAIWFLLSSHRDLEKGE